MKKALLLAGVMIAGFVGGVIALQLDPIIEVGRIRLLESGLAEWVFQVNSDDQVELVDLDSNQIALRIDDATPGLRPLAQPRLFFSTATANGAGYYAFNTTDNIPCVSTGTGPGAWTTIGTTIAPAGLIAGEGGHMKRCW